MIVMTSSLLPTAMAWPLGLQQRLMFSPLVCTVCVHFPAGGGAERGRGPIIAESWQVTHSKHQPSPNLVWPHPPLTSQTLTVLSPEADTSWLGWVGLQQIWSTLSEWPFRDVSLLCNQERAHQPVHHIYTGLTGGHICYSYTPPLPLY